MTKSKVTPNQEAAPPEQTAEGGGSGSTGDRDAQYAEMAEKAQAAAKLYLASPDLPPQAREAFEQTAKVTPADMKASCSPKKDKTGQWAIPLSVGVGAALAGVVVAGAVVVHQKRTAAAAEVAPEAKIPATKFVALLMAVTEDRKKYEKMTYETFAEQDIAKDLTEPQLKTLFHEVRYNYGIEHHLKSNALLIGASGIAIGAAASAITVAIQQSQKNLELADGAAPAIPPPLKALDEVYDQCLKLASGK